VNLPRHQLLADTAFTFDQRREVGVGDALDPFAQQPHDLAGADERRGAVAIRAGQRRRRGREAFGFEQHAGDAGGGFEHLTRPVVGTGAGIECRLEHHLAPFFTHRHRVGDVIAHANGLQRPRRHRS
jgi:hypothetical protein